MEDTERLYLKSGESKVELSSVIGVDECGRGSLISSVVAGAVLWRPYYFFEGLNDSKQLNLKQREKLYQEFEESNLLFAIGSANIKEIEEENILYATRLAMEGAINLVIKKSIGPMLIAITSPPSVLIDGKFCKNVCIRNDDIKQKWIVKGDTKEPSIMAASIVAKVLRDRSIKKLVDKFPEYEKYGWKTNVGYGTKEHLEAIKKYGITPLHRKTFDPIKTWLAEGIIKE